ncbi:MAG: peptidase [Phycisphaerae bacterium]|nr:peptidase [Phycisphaerae bacterium]
MLVPLFVLAPLGSMFLAGCAADNERAMDPAALNDDPTDDYSVALRYGPVNEADRRGAGASSESLFSALMLPAPTNERLGSGAPGPGYWQQRADYKMDVLLDTETDSLSGRMEVTYHNNSPHELDYIWIQLEQNLFSPESLGSRSHVPGGVLRGRPTFPGGYTIEGVRSGGEELERHIHDTLMRVELPEPIEAGETFVYELDWSFPVPPYLRRMGMEEVEQGKIFEFAQWFPHICKYDDVNGWNTLPYLGTGEFYTDFGDYEVNITVPPSYTVIGTGELQNPGQALDERTRERLDRALASDEPIYIIRPDEVDEIELQNGPRTYRWEAEDVRTFAFAASDAFIWDACGADVTDRDGTERRVLCQSIYPIEAHTDRDGVWNPEHEGEVGPAGSTRYVKHSIEFYSEFIYPYPYPVMTNVNGPEGGMEYPMIVFCGARTSERGLFGVTDHEVGHNWFPMLVNSDERRYMWQDEGFNTFINIYSGAAWWQREPDVSRHVRQTLETMLAENPQPINLAPDYQWRRWRGALNYRKTALGLYLLRELVLGQERFDRAFRGYVDRWAFKSPQPADFLRSMQDGAGVDLTWWWRGWIDGSGALDFAVASAESAEDGRSAYVEIVNKGDVVFPVPYRVTFEDGTTRDYEMPVEAWASTNRWRAVIDVEGKKVRGVQIDPKGVFPDIDPRDNTWGSPKLEDDGERVSRRRR